MHANKAIISGRHLECPFGIHSTPILDRQQQSKLSQLNTLADQNIPVNRLTPTHKNLKQHPSIFSVLSDYAAATAFALTVISLHEKIAEHTPPKYKNYIHLCFLGLSMASILLLKHRTNDQTANEISN